MKIIDRLYEEDTLWDKTVAQIKDLVAKRMFPDKHNEDKAKGVLFIDHFRKFMSRKTGGTYSVYNQTLTKLLAYKEDIESLSFEEVTVQWLRDFEKDMSATMSKNARNIHFRNIRAVFNDALDDEVISCYPFRKFKIKGEETEKRSLSVDNLRRLFDCKVEKYAEFYKDMFKLTFFLIGINPVDLAHLSAMTIDGRVEYKRAKTHRGYSIKVEPEALEIIKRWRGNKYLLSILDRWTDYKNFARQTNIALQSMGAKRSGLGGKKAEGIFPDITLYWARHSWATIAAELDIPDAIISQALGHAAENRTTEIYIRRNRKKVDKANRRVIDFVLYGKK